MTISEIVKQKFFPEYSKWEMFATTEQTNDKTTVYRLVECRENIHTGKKYFKTTYEFEANSDEFIKSELEEILIRLQKLFRKDLHLTNMLKAKEDAI